MFRKDLLTLLENNPHSLKDIAIVMDMNPRDVEDDVKHLIKSLKHTGYKLHITPAECLKCGFVFQKDKLHKPGKCPKCHGTWIQEPLLGIEKKR